MDVEAAEAQYRMVPATELTAEKIFDRRWALTVLEQTVARLRQEYVVAGRAELFEELNVSNPATTRRARTRKSRLGWG